MQIVLYSNHCPKCGILSNKLVQANIKFIEENDMEVIISKGIREIPILEIDGIFMNFLESIKWVNERINNGY